MLLHVAHLFLCWGLFQVQRYLKEHSGDNIQYIWIDVSCMDVSLLSTTAPLSSLCASSRNNSK